MLHKNNKEAGKTGKFYEACHANRALTRENRVNILRVNMISPSIICILP
jgi:hypothetical protein